MLASFRWNHGKEITRVYHNTNRRINKIHHDFVLNRCYVNSFPMNSG